MPLWTNGVDAQVTPRPSLAFKDKLFVPKSNSSLTGLPERHPTKTLSHVTRGQDQSHALLSSAGLFFWYCDIMFEVCCNNFSNLMKA